VPTPEKKSGTPSTADRRGAADPEPDAEPEPRPAGGALDGPPRPGPSERANARRAERERRQTADRRRW